MTDAWGEPGGDAAPLAIGDWSGVVVDGGFDDVSIGGARVLRGVRFVIRDADWRTVPVVEQRVVVREGRVEVAFRASGYGAELDGTLTATDEGSALRVAVEATVRSTFRRNRIGLVLLHGPELAGAEFWNGSRPLRFPEAISPHQPARDIRELRWRSEGREHSARLTGEVFEMEDQRNWTDASFKTYGTPLASPFPVEVRPGDVVRQSLLLGSVPDGTSPATVRPPVVEQLIELIDGGTMPELAVGASTAPDADRRGDPAPLPADAVLVELRAMDRNWPAALERARRDADGLPLDIRIVSAGTDDIDAILDAMDGLPEPPARIGVYDARTHVTEPALWHAMFDGLAAWGIRSPLIGGSRAHFTELNRTHESLPAALSALTFSVTPQMHDRSTRQIAESIPMQRLVARDALRIAAGRPLHVGPVTLRARFNAVATTAAEIDARSDTRADLSGGYGAHRDPDTVDPRQHAPALEAWTIASVAALALPGVASIAYFETWGPRGIDDSGIRDRGIQDAGEHTSTWSALERLRAFRGHPILIADAVAPHHAVIGVRDGHRAQLIVASLTPEPTSLRLRLDGADHVVEVPANGVIQISL